MNELETDQSPSGPNHYQQFLSLGGMVLLVIGAIIAFAGKAAADSQYEVQLFVATMTGGYFDSEPVDAAFGWMWFGIVLAVVGAILLLVWVSIRAAQPAASSNQ